MSDQSVNQLSTNRSDVATEYRVYYAIIFLLALPFVSFFWLRDLLLGKAGSKGILGRAKDEASTITPLIFSA